MPKFKQALLIVFGGEKKKTKETKTSYHYQKNPNTDSMHTVSMHTDHPRKTLYNKNIPLIRINFLYSKDKWQIRNDHDNEYLAEQLIASELKKIQPFSRIYIRAHGSINSEELEQCVLNDNEIESVKISYSIISNLLHKYIPKYCQNNIQIFLISCFPHVFAHSLMIELDTLGFIKTSVIAYNDLCIVDEKNFKIMDISTEKRIKYYSSMLKSCGKKLIFNHGKHLPDNKFAVHNYKGKDKYEETEYREFKRIYMQDDGFTRITNNEIPDLTPEQDETIFLVNIIFQSLAPYLNNYEQTRFHRSHRSSGYNRGRFFCNQLLSVKLEEIINFNNTENIIQQTIEEIISFANQTGAYNQFAGNRLIPHKIRMHNQSAMSYILRGLQKFFDATPEPISNQLKNLKNKLAIGQCNLESKNVRKNVFRKTKNLGLSESEIEMNITDVPGRKFI